MTVDGADRAAVRSLLGREPMGDFDIAARDGDGRPLVIRNAPFLDDGTPMPTRFWLLGSDEVRAVSRLESAGGVGQAEAAVDPAAVADAHARYARERDATVDAALERRPTGGVGGTREGVKCLHAHYAWHLAGGDDPVGRWVADRLAAQLDVEIGPSSTTFRHAGRDRTVPVGPALLVAGELADPDPAAPAQLTNALGLAADHLDDVIRREPGVRDATDVRLVGEEPWHLAVVEHGAVPTSPAILDREAAEDVFRLLATQDRAERLTNPGLEPDRVDTVLGTCCILLAVMRRLHLDRVIVSATANPTRGAC